MITTIALNTTANVANAAYILRRVDGVWSAMGTGCNEQVHQIAVDPSDGTIYACGVFTLAGGIANTVYVAKWDGSAWTALDVGLNGAAYCMAVAPDGDLYIGGTFTDIVGGGGGTYNKIVRWDGTNWNAVGAGLNGDVDALAIDSEGNVYAGGDFTDLLGGGLANANYIAKWDGSAWSALGTGMNAAVADLAVEASDNVYAVGTFTTGNSVTLNYVGMWNGTTFEAMGGDDKGLKTGNGYAVLVAPNGLVYVSGNATQFGDNDDANYIASWNGAAFAALNDGLQNEASDLALDDDGNLYAVGGFTSADGMTIAARIAVWNGSIWAPLDVELPGSPTPQAICIFGDRLFVGFDTTGTATTSGEPASTITNSTTSFLYPKFIIKRSGGTTAVLESIRNLDTGKALLFNHGLLDGEKIEIDLAPGKKTIKTTAGDSTSDAKRDMLASSDLADFALHSGDNDIRVYMSVTGAPTLAAFIQWEARYAGIDGAAS